MEVEKSTSLSCSQYVSENPESPKILFMQKQYPQQMARSAESFYLDDFIL